MNCLFLKKKAFMFHQEEAGRNSSRFEINEISELKFFEANTLINSQKRNLTFKFSKVNPHMPNPT